MDANKMACSISMMANIGCHFLKSVLDIKGLLWNSSAHHDGNRGCLQAQYVTCSALSVLYLHLIETFIASYIATACRHMQEVDVLISKTANGDILSFMAHCPASRH